VSHQGPISLQVIPTMTVAQLKEKVEEEFEIPVRVQRWILGKLLASDDTKMLQDYNVNSNGCPIFLYLVAPGRYYFLYNFVFVLRSPLLIWISNISILARLSVCMSALWLAFWWFSSFSVVLLPSLYMFNLWRLETFHLVLLCPFCTYKIVFV